MHEMINRDRWVTIILAAGKGTRMKSPMAKVLHRLADRILLSYPIALARDMGCERIVVVVGHQADRIRQAVDDGEIGFVDQTQQLGTGHAICQTADTLTDFDGNILILCGDVPLLRLETIRAMTHLHINEKAAITVLTALLDDPAGYGRIVKDDSNNVIKIVEERDATDREKEIREINTGIYCVRAGFLFEAVQLIDNDNAQGEYYLTDIFGIARSQHAIVRSLVVEDPDETMGINTVTDLEKANRIMAQRGHRFV